MTFSKPGRAVIYALTTTAALLLASTAGTAQTDAGWITLLEGEDLGNLQPLGNANWHGEDGAVVADQRSGDSLAFLITEDSYGDFEAIVEFWASDDANSGVFIRCTNLDPLPGSTNCYEVNIFDQRGDPTYGTGSVVNFAEVDPMPRAGGQWNRFHIIAEGRQIRVILNGEETVNFRNGLFASGPIALQYGQGVMKFRKFVVRPL